MHGYIKSFLEGKGSHSLVHNNKSRVLYRAEVPNLLPIVHCKLQNLINIVVLYVRLFLITWEQKKISITYSSRNQTYNSLNCDFIKQPICPQKMSKEAFLVVLGNLKYFREIVTFFRMISCRKFGQLNESKYFVFFTGVLAYFKIGILEGLKFQRVCALKEYYLILHLYI